MADAISSMFAPLESIAAQFSIVVNLATSYHYYGKESAMNKVKEILRAKGDRVLKISKDATVLDALKLMAEKQTGSVIVMNGDKVAGIFTERDFARKVGLVDAKPSAIKVREVMTGELITVGPDDSVNQCMAIITENRIRHLPVIKEGQVVGIVSIGDVVKDIIGELQFMVKQLENYITGFR